MSRESTSSVGMGSRESRESVGSIGDSGDLKQLPRESQSQPASTMPLISIVLPTYNGARYLEESIESVCRQTFAAWELIVVDDASSDETPQIIAAYCARDPRICSVRHKTNRRLPAALNTGFAAARGALLSWTSDDNHYQPTALEELARVLAEQSNVDFVFADYAIIDDAGRTVRQVRAQEPLELLAGEATIPCFLYRRAVYEQLGGYAEDLFLAEDYDFWLRVLLSSHCMTNLHKPLYEYRRHERSLTDKHRGQTFAAAEGALLRNLPQLMASRPALRGQVYLFLASLAWWRGEWGRALGYTLRGARYAPGQLAAKGVAFVGRRLRRTAGGAEGEDGAGAE
jgi:glycosyltransferase involved in cell wall biosynthesis